jgi:hypothetical protein
LASRFLLSVWKIVYLLTFTARISIVSERGSSRA